MPNSSPGEIRLTRISSPSGVRSDSLITPETRTYRESDGSPWRKRVVRRSKRSRVISDKMALSWRSEALANVFIRRKLMMFRTGWRVMLSRLARVPGMCRGGLAIVRLPMCHLGDTNARHGPVCSRLFRSPTDPRRAMLMDRETLSLYNPRPTVGTGERERRKQSVLAEFFSFGGRRGCNPH